MIEEQGNRPNVSDILEAAEKYGRNIFINECMKNGVCDDHDLSDAFIAGAEWQEEQGQTKEGEVIEDGEFIKFSDGTYIDLCPDLGKKSFDFKAGDKVIVQIRKA
ncbi:MAG: hypothetical protein J5382_10145 [Bacteroidales bacterium]|nr:hypothetical protein [Bacteroidales bacterium]